jgi:hypothetical protein
LSSRSEDGVVHRPTERELNIHQIPTRIHENDWALLKKLFIDSDLKWQQFADACIDAFIHGNPHILKVIAGYRDVIRIPLSKRDEAALSHRERNSLLDELEREEEKGPVG